MSKFFLIKKGNIFVPDSADDQMKAYKVEEGGVVRAITSDQRNILHHRKYFAMIRFCFHHLPERFTFTDEEDLREALLIAIGWKTTRHYFDGTEREIAKSIAFDKVGQERFEKIYSRTLDVVARLVEIDSEQVETELLNFM